MGMAQTANYNSSASINWVTNQMRFWLSAGITSALSIKALRFYNIQGSAWSQGFVDLEWVY